MSVKLPRPVRRGQCNEKIKERKVRRKLPLKHVLGLRVAPSPSNLCVLSAFLLWAAKIGYNPPSSSKPSSTCSRFPSRDMVVFRASSLAGLATVTGHVSKECSRACIVDMVC
jgi:hypothetical protein